MRPLIDAVRLKTVSSSSEGIELVPSKRNGVAVMLDSSTAGPVRFFFQDVNGDCSAVTAKRGRRIAAGNGYEFLTSDDGRTDKLCALLESASTPVVVSCEVY